MEERAMGRPGFRRRPDISGEGFTDCSSWICALCIHPFCCLVLALKRLIFPGRGVGRGLGEGRGFRDHRSKELKYLHVLIYLLILHWWYIDTDSGEDGGGFGGGEDRGREGRGLQDRYNYIFYFTFHDYCSCSQTWSERPSWRRRWNFSETVKLQERVNYLRKVLEDLLMEAEEEENCDGMTSRKANFGSTDIRFRKKNMEPAAPKKNTS